MNAQKPRRTGASADLLGSVVDAKATAARRPSHARAGRVLCAQWVIGRSGLRRLVVPYQCPCGEWHEAQSRGWEALMIRTAACGQRVELTLGEECGP